MFSKLNTKKLAALFLCLVTITIFSCKKSDSLTDNTPVLEPPVKADDAIKVTATVTGTVIDENNKPVAGAAVSSDTYSTTTDTLGNFVFKNINISKANGHVTVVKTGYYNGCRSFVTATGKNNYVKIQLIKQVVMGTVAAATGGIVNTLTGASITFPANAFVTAGGAAFNGTVTVYATWIDPTASNLPLVVPGDLRGVDSTNGEYILKSYGMVGAELRDNNGNVIKIAPGKTATVSFPIPAALQADAPQTIALWHFDETAARWKQEGTAIKSGNNYIGQVNKFSFWNLDVPGNFVNLDLKLMNSINSLPLVNTLVKITSLVTNASAYGHTNDSGYVSGYVPKNENLKLEVISGTACNTSAVLHTQNVGPYTANTSLGTINVTPPSNTFLNFTGNVKNCSGQPVTNGYISLTLANSNSAIAFFDGNGKFNFNLIQCGGSQVYSYYVVDLDAGSYNTITTGSASTSTVNLGTITCCSNIPTLTGILIAGSIGNNAAFWIDGVPTLLTYNIASPPSYPFGNAVKTLTYNSNTYVLTNQTYSSTNVHDTLKVWKDGVTTNIITNTNNPPGQPYSIYGVDFDVYNNDVYICGTENNPGIQSNLRVWKNGVSSVLPTDTFTYASVSAIKVVNGDVYVSGKGFNNGNPSKPLYWKNGVLNILPTTSGGGVSTTDIFVNNTDVYITGNEGLPYRAVYWKNGIKITLPPPANFSKSECTSIFIYNNDVYVAGNVGYVSTGGDDVYAATYWKNGNPVLLSNNYPPVDYDSKLYDIFIKNNIVCTAGSASKRYSIIEPKPIHFQNSKEIPLTGYTTNLKTYAFSISVK